VREYKVEQFPALHRTDIELLISQAIDKNVPIETLERLLAMRKELKAEYAKEAYNRSMTDFQEECPVIRRNKKVYGKNGFLYAYTPTESIIAQVKGGLKKHGFSYAISTETLEKSVRVTCISKHIEGHEECTSVEVPFVSKTAIMSDAQQIVGTITLATRYAFRNAFGIMTGDVDVDSMNTEKEVTYITHEQIETIHRLLPHAGFSIRDVLEGQKVGDISEIAQAQAEGIIKTLQVYIERNRY
jgi:hypothetical protein